VFCHAGLRLAVEGIMSYVQRLERVSFAALGCLAAAAIAITPVAADDTGGAPRIVRVEEDWELQVATPDPSNDAPQISVVIAPTADVDWAYAEFDINHHSHPNFIAGGLQLQVWSGGHPIVANNDPDGGVISQPQEKIRWTQGMKLDDGVLTFAITGGTSTTWGAFGGDGKLSIRTAAPLTDLNGYDTGVSLKNSGVGFAANRVQSLKITAVRRYTADGQVLTSEEARICYQRE